MSPFTTTLPSLPRLPGPTLLPTTGTGNLTLQGPENLLILPSQLREMYLTRLTVLPAGVLLLSSCVLLWSIVLVYFRRVIKLYLGLLFYAFTEVLLLVQIVVFYLISAERVLGEVSCGLTKSLGLFTMTLPVFAILLVTLSRLIFLKYPFQHRNILRIRYQAGCLAGTVLLVGCLAVWPALGTCRPFYSPALHICLLKFDEVCGGFIGVYVLVGMVGPTLAVLGIYIYVYHMLQEYRARREHRDSVYSGRGGRLGSVVSVQDPPPLSKKGKVPSPGKESSTPRITLSDCSSPGGITIVNEIALQFDQLSSVEIVTKTKVIFPSSRAEQEEAFSSPPAPLSSSTDVMSLRPPSASKRGSTPSSNHLSPDWYKHCEVAKERAKLSDIRLLKPYLKEAVRKLSLVTEYTSGLRRREIPWSLVLLTLLHITSSVPWIFMEFYSHYFWEASSSERAWIDVANGVMVVSVGVSPLLYILFTRLIRDKVKQVFLRAFRIVTNRLC